MSKQAKISPRLDNLMERIGVLLWETDNRREKIKMALGELIEAGKADRNVRPFVTQARSTMSLKLKTLKARYLELRNIEGPVIGAIRLGEEKLDDILIQIEKRIEEMEKNPTEAGYHNNMKK